MYKTEVDKPCINFCNLRLTATLIGKTSISNRNTYIRAYSSDLDICHKNSYVKLLLIVFHVETFTRLPAMYSVTLIT